MNRVKRVIWTLLFTVIACGPAIGQNLDGVTGARGITAYGTVTEMSPTQVTFTDSQGTKKLFPVNEIQKITYGGEPGDLKKARESILRGRLESARSDLEGISTESISRKEILQDVDFFKAFCDGRLALVSGGDKAAAVRALLSFLGNSNNANSYHYYSAVELVGDLAVGLGRYENAIKYYRLLGESPWPEYQLRANELEARAMMADGQFAEALPEYEAVIASGLDTAEARERKLMAMTGKAVCLAATGKAAEGIEIVESMIAENDSRQKPLLFARAYNALGNCYLNAEKPKEALLAFLHVSLLFYQDADAHAESLYHLSKLWRTVNRSERAIRAKSLLTTRYSGSSWASKK